MILLIRHGATAGNLQRRYIGRTDEGLCDVGVAQAEGLRRALAARKNPLPAALFISPMRRCRETAALVFPEMAPAVIDGLREMDFGILEGNTHAEMECDPRYRAWVASEGRNTIPDGESRASFDARCVGAFLALHLAPSDDAAIVCHGGTVMALLSALGDSRRGYYDYQPKNAEAFVCEMDKNDRLILVDRIAPPGPL